MPQVGCRYLLFLEQVNSEGEFRILTGYELKFCQTHILPYYGFLGGGTVCRGRVGSGASSISITSTLLPKRL